MVPAGVRAGPVVPGPGRDVDAAGVFIWPGNAAGPARLVPAAVGVAAEVRVERIGRDARRAAGAADGFGAAVRVGDVEVLAAFVAPLLLLLGGAALAGDAAGAGLLAVRLI